MYDSNEARAASKTPLSDSQRETTNAILPPISKQLLSKPELATVLNVSERTIENWLAEKRIPRLQLSARLQRFSLAKVLAALGRYEIKEVGARR